MTDNERLTKVISWSGLTENAFSLAIGYKRGQSIYNILKNRRPLTRSIATKICKKFPQINPIWLLIGEGDMLNNSVHALSVVPGTINDHQKGIPYYEIAATMSPLVVYADEKEIPLYYIDMPALKGCDFALPAWGDSMYPKIKNGQIIAVKEIKDRSQIQWGEIYLVVTDEIRAVKYVRRHPNSKLVILASENRENFDDITIERDKIHGLFIVKGQINILVN